jgi:hypothetical protein
MEAKIPPDDCERPWLSDEEIERLMAVELACECLLAHVEELERAGADESSGLRAA